MKSKIIFVIILASLTLLNPVRHTYAAGPPDQFCASDGGAYTTMIRSVSNQTTQTFKPNITNISRVTITIKGDGVGKLGIGIAKNGSMLAWNNEGAMAEPNSNKQTMTFTFNDLGVLINQEYSLVPRISTDNNTLYWHYDYDCYDRGSAYIGKEVKDYDFDFAVYGFTQEGPPVSALDLDKDADKATPTTTVTAKSTATVTANAEGDATSNVTLVDQQTLTSNITKDIAPPSDIVVIDTPNDNGGSLDISWKKSNTEGVSSYTIFRQTEIDGDIYKIGKSDTTKLFFTDTNAETGKIYYYFIRANKGDLQSENSNKVKGISIANIGTTTNDQNTSSQNNYLWYFLTGGFFMALIATVIFFYLRYRKHKDKETKIG